MATIEEIEKMKRYMELDSRGHEKLTETVSCTEYDDGTKVYVNYGYEDYSTDGVTVPARDYLVVR